MNPSLLNLPTDILKYNIRPCLSYLNLHNTQFVSVGFYKHIVQPRKANNKYVPLLKQFYKDGARYSHEGNCYDFPNRIPIPGQPVHTGVYSCEHLEECKCIQIFKQVIIDSPYMIIFRGSIPKEC